jgi:hypothetical protein
MLCRYVALQVFLGAVVALALTELWLLAPVEEEPEPVEGQALVAGGALPEIPPMYRRLPVLFPDDTPVRADEFVRSGR